MNPEVSVILPSHNGERFVAAAIESVLAQTGVDLELIVVDDFSGDRTPEIARSYDRVRFIALTKRGGNAYATVNAALSIARGRFLSVLHQDDLFKAGKLRAHLEQMAGDERIALCYSALQFIDAGDRVVATLRSPLGRGDHVCDGVDELRHLAVQNYINVCNGMMRRSAFDEVGPFPEALWFTGEWAIWTRLARRWKVGYVDRPLCCFRVHPDSQTQSRTLDAAEFRAQLQAVVDEIFEDLRLPAAVRARRRMALANIAVSTALLQLYRGDRRTGLGTLSEALRHTRPWELPGLVRSSAVIPRSLARLRAARR